MAESFGLWNNLPSIILVKIFSYLNRKDLLNASSSCKAWRHNLFHPKLWRKVVFHVSSCDIDNEDDSSDGLRFLANRCGWFTHNVVIEVDGSNPDNVNDVLIAIKDNNNLRSLSIKPLRSRLSYMPHAHQKQLFFGILKHIISTTYSLETLSFGLYASLTQQAVQIFEPLSRHQGHCLRRLHLASTLAAARKPMSLASWVPELHALEELSLDYDLVDDDLLIGLSMSKKRCLRRLIVHVVPSCGPLAETSAHAWRQLSSSHPRLEVSVNLFEFPPDVGFLFVREMPLVHLRSYFLHEFNEEVFRRLAYAHAHSLETLVLVDILRDEYEDYASFLSFEVDPVVIFTWQCKKLRRLKIYGYLLMADSLVGISRLRGPQLTHFDVPENCICTLEMEAAYGIDREGALAKMKAQVSDGLQRPWSPMEVPEDGHLNESNSDQLYLPDILSDQSW